MSANAETVLSSMFAEYKRRIACGIPYSKAVQFRSDWCGLADVWDELIDADQVEWLERGVVALRQATVLRLEQSNQELANEVSNEKKERRSAIVWDIVKLFLGSLIALAVEHRYAIIDWLRSLF